MNFIFTDRILTQENEVMLNSRLVNLAQRSMIPRYTSKGLYKKHKHELSKKLFNKALKYLKNPGPFYLCNSFGYPVTMTKFS